MTVRCAKCGEELMGAVNRCWRCGQEFVARGGDSDLPPIRRRPVVDTATEVFVAEFFEPPPGTPNRGNDQPTNKMRRGSPFSDRGTAVLETFEPESSLSTLGGAREREAKYQRNGGAAAGAALAMPLGFISLLAAFVFPLAGFPLSLVGLAFGVWGLSSRRRTLAVVGLLLCCLSLAIATVNGSVEIYTRAFGVAPWESNTSSP